MISLPLMVWHIGLLKLCHLYYNPAFEVRPLNDFHSFNGVAYWDNNIVPYRILIVPHMTTMHSAGNWLCAIFMINPGVLMFHKRKLTE